MGWSESSVGSEGSVSESEVSSLPTLDVDAGDSEFGLSGAQLTSKAPVRLNVHRKLNCMLARVSWLGFLVQA